MHLVHLAGGVTALLLGTTSKWHEAGTDEDSALEWSAGAWTQAALRMLMACQMCNSHCDKVFFFLLGVPRYLCLNWLARANTCFRLWQKMEWALHSSRATLINIFCNIEMPCSSCLQVAWNCVAHLFNHVAVNKTVHRSAFYPGSCWMALWSVSWRHVCV